MVSGMGKLPLLMGTIEDTIKGMQRIDPGMTLVQRFNGVIVGEA
jgi:hypothetical protein